jgi:lipoprotein-anchoring transpeptidase ErfK/SrfK
MRRTLIATFVLLLALAPAARAQSQPAQPRIAAGVSAAGADLSGLTLDEAAGRLYTTFAHTLGSPLSTHVAGRKIALAPGDAKLAFDVKKSAHRAYNAGKAAKGAKVDVPLYVTFDAKAVAAYAQKVADAVHVDARDATVDIGLKRITKVASRDGRSLNATALAAAASKALADPRLPRILQPALTTVHPKVTTGKLASAYGTILTVDRGTFTLRLFKRLKFFKSYRVAVGQPAYPTPTGRFSITSKAVNPTWNVPNSPWAGALANESIPGGSDANPLRARWMGLAGGVGIHGTNEPGSIGSRASHGCIRMTVPDVIDLYPRVPMGTPVVIGD